MLPEDRANFDRAQDEGERKAIEDVRKYGVHILDVFDDEGAKPDFSYTVGLWHTHGHPEILISGLKESLRQRLLNNLNHMIGNGRQFRDGQSYTDVIDNYRCYFQEFPKQLYREYLGWDRWFYDGDDFEAVQMLWPSVDHIFPWDELASESLRNAQEIFTRIPTRIS
jgi:hypothetical protein